MKIRKLGIILLATIITVTNMVVYANSADDSIIHSSDDVIKEDTKNKEMEKNKEEYPKSTPSEAKPKPSEEDKFVSTPTVSIPSEATPSEATPSEATPSEATPSEAVPVEVIEFESIEPDEVPSWYTKVKKRLFGGKKHYQFTDRYGEEHHRIYGYYEEEAEAAWYECQLDGSVTNESFWIDLEWEDLNLAPLRWEAAEPQADDIRDLSERIFGDAEMLGIDIDLAKSNHEAENYDGTMYDIWSLDEEELAELYFFYGHAVNGILPGENTWFESTEDGQILDEVPDLVLSVMSADARAIDATATEFEFGQTYFGVKDHPTGTLYIPCELGAKYNWQITVNVKRVSSTGGSSLKYYQCFKKDGNGPWYLADEASGHTGYFPVTVPYGANSKYYYTGSSRYLTAEEVNQGWYKTESSSEGDRINYIDPEGDSFRMAAQHQSFGDWYITKEATCTSKGTKQRTCMGCGAAETAYIDALGHNWEADYYTGANNGTYYKRCTRCSEKTDVRNNPYTITYHANGGKGTMAVQNCTYTAKLNLLSNTFQRDYYTFKNWTTEPDGGGKIYSDTQPVSNLTAVYGGNIDLYAQWQPKSYNITFDDGWDGTQNITRSYVYTHPFGELPVFKRLGYTLSGFFSEPEGGEKITAESKAPHSDTIYYAHWEANSYDIFFHTGKSYCGSEKKRVTYDGKVGILPAASMEDFEFLGWYTEPYSQTYVEGIMCGDANPPDDKQIKSEDVYRIAGHTQAYAYLVLQYEELENGVNRRPGPDGYMNTKDDNYYLNGEDGIAGTHDDEKLYPGEDGKYGTKDDYYLDKEGHKIYPGNDSIFRTEDDYRDNGDGTNTRPGPDCNFKTEDDVEASNGLDGLPGTMDDWIDNNENYPDTNLRPGPDGVFGTGDDEVYWNGPDGIPGTGDDEPVHPGLDGKLETGDDWVENGHNYPETNLRPGPDGVFGTEDDEVYWNGPDGIPGTGDDEPVHPGLDGKLETGDDWVENGHNYPETNLRPGPDGVFGTEDDEVYWNGPDGIPGTEDDELVHPGLDGKLETGDDWVENGHNYPETNLRPGPDGLFGTEDDEVYWNGPDRIPGTEDDKKILPGPDGQYGTEDDCYDNKDKQEGTNIRPGSDGVFGTEDDELWLNGPDEMPGTDDDIKYVHRNSSGGGSGYGNRLVGRGAYKPVIEIMDAALEAMEPQTVGLVSNFYDTYQSFKKGQEMNRYIVNTGMQEIQMEAATGSQVKKETQESRWSDEAYSDKDVGPVVLVKTDRDMKVIWMILLLILLCVLGYEIYKAKKKD